MACSHSGLATQLVEQGWPKSEGRGFESQRGQGPILESPENF